jgi:hypothetical protein
MKAVLFLVPLLLVPQEDAEKQKRLKQALEWLGDKDPEVSQSARAELLALGKDALPAIERKLEEKGLMELARLWRDIERGAPALDPYALPEDDTAMVKIDRETADKYIRAKYAEAMAFARKNQYQRALDMAKGIEALEPRSPVVDRVKQLHRYCDNMITQTSLIEAKLVQEKLAYVTGEPVTLAIRMKNIYKKEMTLRYDGAAGRAAEGLVVIEIESSIKTLKDESTSSSRHQEFPFEGEIPLAPGAQWERMLQLDTVFGLPDDLEVQSVVVNAWTQPSKIETDGVNITRRLQFEPAILKLVPKRYSHFLEKPLEWLSKTIETGQPAQETWICTQLLSGDERRRGAEVLVKAMEKTDNPEYRPALAKMLTELTGEKLGVDPKKWTEWLAKQGPEKKKK